MKIILLSVLFIMPIAIGFHLSKKTEKCYKNLKYLNMCLEKIHIQITQYLIPLGDIFYELSKEEIKPMDEIFLSICKGIENGGQTFKYVFYSEFELKKETLGFANEEMDLIKNISELMGSSNVTGQEKYLAGLIKSSEKLLTYREEQYKTKASSYKKLGILAGAFLVIVFL
ncbi:MAG: stage III sporulation protein AB [Eubacteriaceae bacterium]